MGEITLRDYLQTTEDAISAGRIENALVNCQLILARYPHSLEAQRLLGEAYLAQGQLEKAQQAFDWVLTNDPENVIAYCSRALISERMQDYDTALDCYQQAYELSRGNSQIRQEFNNLSLKVGQLHFVFSRAGLARLYMRGDLLPQAIQEWEAVLTTNPNRLDAQTGLLETYWREGLYEKVEQIGRQILDEVPGCLKALLLLSNVTYAKNTRQAQQYLQLAESLDPDMVMAQELFGDLIASQPADPFWATLKKAPAVVEQAASEPALAAVSSTNGTGKHGAQAATPYADSLVQWDSLDSIMEPQQEYQPALDASSLLTWTETNNSSATWANTFDQPSAAVEPANDLADSLRYLTPQSDSPTDDDDQGPQHAHALFDDETAPEMRQPASEHNDTPAGSHAGQSEAEQPWYQVEVFEEYETWDSTPDATTVGPHTTDKQAAEAPAPPAWLEMLTSSGWKQPQPLEEETQLDASAQADEEQESASDDHTAASPSVFDAPLSADIQPEEASFNPSALFAGPNEADDDELSFGPAWLRSLGASLINEETSPASEQASSQEEEATQAEPLFTKAVESPTFSQQASQLYVPPVTEQAAPIRSQSPALDESPADAAEVNPNPSVESWLNQAVEKLSQPDQSVLTTLEALESELRSHGFVPLAPGTLSTFAQEQEPVSALSSELTVPPASEPAEPLWPAAPGPVTQSASPSLDTLAAMAHPAVPAQDFRPTTPAASEPLTYATPVGRSDPLLDSELETTMKRPAIRLQPMTQRPSSQSSSTLRGHTERTTPRHATEGNLSGKERLLKGYQYQLAGDYDEAMQEYRVIIRNAPELVGEVISNMRALLKIAPRYGPGYRILGDAYMRQGEYLQAMEAYNKALNMTRRTRG